MSSRRSFLPELTDAKADGRVPAAPDRRDGAVYVLDPGIELAVDVALATGRPLLLRGDPGSGKSSLAAFLARNLGWRYYEHVVTSRTRAQDLLWSFDSMRKLADASARHDADSQLSLVDSDYLEPGVMWWAIDRDSALRRGAPAAVSTVAEEPGQETNRTRDPDRVVVLIDEIDKADPDVPNGLLVPLGSTEFVVTPTKTLVRQRPLTDPTDDGPRQLIVISTNEERELPPAFMRRCIVYKLERPGPDKLVEIARRHFQVAGYQVDETDMAMFTALAARFVVLCDEVDQRHERPPSTAEFLDAVHVCHRMHITVDPADDTWLRIERLTLLKSLLSDPGRMLR